MRWRWRGARTVVVVGLLVVLVVGACSGGEPTSVDRSDPPIPTEPARPPIDITVIPEEITVEYVQAVVDELDRTYSDTVRLAQSEGAVTDEVVARFEALYPPDQSDFEVQDLKGAVGDGFVHFQAPIGDRRSPVERLVVSDQDCVQLLVVRDYTAFSVVGEPFLSVWIFMLAHPERPNEFNPTPWLFVYDGPGDPLSKPKGSCSDYNF